MPEILFHIVSGIDRMYLVCGHFVLYLDYFVLSDQLEMAWSSNARNKRKKSTHF